MRNVEILEIWKSLAAVVVSCNSSTGGAYSTPITNHSSGIPPSFVGSTNNNNNNKKQQQCPDNDGRGDIYIFSSCWLFYLRYLRICMMPAHSYPFLRDAPRLILSDHNISNPSKSLCSKIRYYIAIQKQSAAINK